MKNTLKYKIRKIQEEDAEELLNFIKELLKEKPLIMIENVPNIEEERKYILQFKQNLLICAEINGKIIGTLEMRIGNFIKNKHVGFLGISVLKEYRNKGVGTNLLNHAINWAKNKNINKISVEVFSNNILSINFFLKNSFIFEGTRKYQYKIDGELVDGVFMALFFTKQ